jgi:hypothetical protein
MDNSFGAAMAGLVIEDASRMSGVHFADARGAGVARRVRTRRRVRAAGMGGASAVAVGALAFGAMNMPWGATTVAGVASDDCATRSPSDGAYVYEVVVRQGVTPVDTIALTDAVTGATFLTATLQPDGTYVFTDADGNPLRAAAEELPGSYWIIGAQVPPDGGGAATRGAAEILVKSVSTADSAGLPSAVRSALDDCYTPSPTPSSVPSATPSSDPIPSPEPSRPVAATVVTRPEDVTSPFKCGFRFPTEASEAPHLTITGTAWTSSAGIGSVGDNNADSVWSDFVANGSGNAVHGMVRDSIGADQPGYRENHGIVLPGLDPADDAQMALIQGLDYTAGATSGRGLTFVSVRDGMVVGTTDDRHAGSDAGALFDGQSTFFLPSPETAFLACPGETPSAGSVEVYFVAGVVGRTPAGGGTLVGPEYAWSRVATFNSGAPGN